MSWFVDVQFAMVMNSLDVFNRLHWRLICINKNKNKSEKMFKFQRWSEKNLIIFRRMH